MPGSKKTGIQEKEPKKKNNDKFIYAVGRRKEAVARVRLYPSGTKEIKKGEVFVNDKKIEEVFPGKIQKAIYTEPLQITDTLAKFEFNIKVSGGGHSSQLGAIILGISRALVAFDSEKYRSVLRKKGFLTRDARVRERRKVGMGGKARRKRQSPKR